MSTPTGLYVALRVNGHGQSVAQMHFIELDGSAADARERAERLTAESKHDGEYRVFELRAVPPFP